MNLSDFGQWRECRKFPLRPRSRDGVCRWCEKAIDYSAHALLGWNDPWRRSPSRHEWHRDCHKKYQFAKLTHQGALMVAESFQWRCANCDEKALQGHADHKNPLWSAPVPVTAEVREQFWGVDNLQWLCVPCHKTKTRQEAASLERARWNRRAPAIKPGAAEAVERERHHCST